MVEDFATRLAAVDQRMLAPLVAQALDKPEVELLNWGYEFLNGGFGHWAGVCGIYRFSGMAHAGAELLPWTLVLKALARTSGANSSPDPAAWYYWKREVLVYQSGLLANLPRELTAPRCFGVVEQPGKEIWLWLEAIREETGRVWPLERYNIAARHLGQFNGAYLAGRPQPAQPWLTQGRWHDWESMAEPYFNDLHTWCQHPSAQRMLPEASIQGMLALWAKRNQLLHTLAQLPRCFCHRDAFRRNLMARQSANGDPQTVAIDWAFAGSGAVGEEVATLVRGSLIFLEVPITQVQALDATIFAGYLAGLHAAGWQADPKLVRLGYTISMALMGMEHVCLDLQGMHSDMSLDVVERIFGHSIDKIEAQHAGFFRFTLDRADEAEGLLRGITAVKGGHSMSTETTRTNDLLAVVQAFDAACNANDVDRALAFFADDTVVRILPPPPPSMPSAYVGEQQVRTWLELQLQHFHVAARSHQVIGDRVTWEATVSADFLRQMELASVEDTVEAVVQNGKIRSFTVTLAPDSARALEGAMRHTGVADTEASETQAGN
jgi:ketosteroid isomerase-like protein